MIQISPDSDDDDFADGGKSKDGVMTKGVTWKGNDFCTKGPFLSYSKTVIGNYLGKLPPSTALKCKPGM